MQNSEEKINAIEMITAIAVVSKGLEDPAKEEITEIISAKINKINPTAVEFSCKNYEDLFKLVYRTQSANKILFLIDTIDFQDDEDLLNKIKKSFEKKQNQEKINFFLNNSTSITFRASCSKLHHLEPEIGEIFLDAFKDRVKVDLKNYELDIYVHVFEDKEKNTKNQNKTAYLGIDFSYDLSKRDYKIFNSPMSLKGTTGFGLLKLSGYSPKDILLNPHCNSGIIEIESALYSNKISPRFYSKKFPFMNFSVFKDIDFEKIYKKIDDERTEEKTNVTGSDLLLKNIIAAKKNAKIAGVEKLVDFRRIDMDWMDLKFEQKEIDKIVTFICGSSAHKDIKTLGKNYKEFFYQAEYIIKNKGIVVVLCLSKEILIKISKEFFDLFDEKEIYSGEQLMHVLFFRKKSKADKKQK